MTRKANGRFVSKKSETHSTEPFRRLAHAIIDGTSDTKEKDTMSKNDSNDTLKINVELLKAMIAAGTDEADAKTFLIRQAKKAQRAEKSEARAARKTEREEKRAADEEAMKVFADALNAITRNVVEANTEYSGVLDGKVILIALSNDGKVIGKAVRSGKTWQRHAGVTTVKAPKTATMKRATKTGGRKNKAA